MELASKELVTELTFKEKLSHNLHHIICTFCRRAKRQFKIIDKTLQCQMSAESLELSNNQKEKVLEAIKKNNIN
jgi:ribosomal protein L31E